eukprot:62143-Heterocapsa_arctica.AAC.1
MPMHGEPLEGTWRPRGHLGPGALPAGGWDRRHCATAIGSRAVHPGGCTGDCGVELTCDDDCRGYPEGFVFIAWSRREDDPGIAGRVRALKIMVEQKWEDR